MRSRMRSPLTTSVFAIAFRSSYGINRTASASLIAKIALCHLLGHAPTTLSLYCSASMFPPRRTANLSISFMPCQSLSLTKKRRSGVFLLAFIPLLLSFLQGCDIGNWNESTNRSKKCCDRSSHDCEKDQEEIIHQILLLNHRETYDDYTDN